MVDSGKILDTKTLKPVLGDSSSPSEAAWQFCYNQTLPILNFCQALPAFWGLNRISSPWSVESGFKLKRNRKWTRMSLLRYPPDWRRQNQRSKQVGPVAALGEDTERATTFGDDLLLFSLILLMWQLHTNRFERVRGQPTSSNHANSCRCKTPLTTSSARARTIAGSS